MAEPFWSQPDAVNDEVPVQADISVPSVPQTTVGVGEQVIESDPTALFIGLGLLSICLVFLVIDALRGSPESSSQVGSLVFLVFLFSIAVSIKGLLTATRSWSCRGMPSRTTLTWPLPLESWRGGRPFLPSTCSTATTPGLESTPMKAMAMMAQAPPRTGSRFIDATGRLWFKHPLFHIIIG